MNAPTSSDPSGTPKCPVYREAREKPEWQQLLRGPVDIEPHCGHFINKAIVERGNWADSTVMTYSATAARIINFLHDQGVTVCEAELSHIHDLFNQLAERLLATKTYGSYRTVAIHMYKQIATSKYDANITPHEIREFININKLPSKNKIERKGLTRKEVEQLLNSAPCFRDQLMIQLGVESGPRNLCICTRKTKDVDFDQNIVRLYNIKSDRNYVMPISNNLSMKLRHWIEVTRETYTTAVDNNWLFPSRWGGHVGPGHFSNMVREAAQDAGIQEVIATINPTERQKEAFNTEKIRFYRVTPHTLRHTFNGLMRDQGVSREIRSQALDHSSTEITKEYYENESENHLSVIRSSLNNLSI